MTEAAKKITTETVRRDRREPLHMRGRPVEQLRAEVDHLLDDFVRGYWHVPFRKSVVDIEPYWRGEIGFGPVPAVDIIELDDGYKLTAELPGVDAQYVDVTFSEGALTIEGKKDEDPQDLKHDHFVSERHYGGFHRSFRIPDGVDADKIEASFKNGVLTLTLPKTLEAQRKQKKIAIENA